MHNPLPLQNIFKRRNPQLGFDEHALCQNQFLDQHLLMFQPRNPAIQSDALILHAVLDLIQITILRYFSEVIILNGCFWPFFIFV